MDAMDRSVGRCGSPMFDCHLRLRDWPEGGYHATDKPRPRGEILLGGKGVALGYFKRPEETQEVFWEEDGIRWFASGDIGELFTRRQRAHVGCVR